MISPTQDAYANVRRLRPMKGETVWNLANRMYTMQMSIFEAWAGHDLFVPMVELPPKVQAGWLSAARKKLAKYHRKSR